jgi:hypothetical protein
MRYNHALYIQGLVDTSKVKTVKTILLSTSTSFLDWRHFFQGKMILPTQKKNLKKKYNILVKHEIVQSAHNIQE